MICEHCGDYIAPKDEGVCKCTLIPVSSDDGLIKKFLVAGRWERTYLAKDETEANRMAYNDIQSINNANIKMYVQEVRDARRT